MVEFSGLIKRENRKGKGRMEKGKFRYCEGG